jgi:two-component system cell cycle sensor histidine kinase/response regulator CckA
MLLNILHIEDTPADVELVEVALKRNGFTPQIRRVETRTELLRALTDPVEYDVILSDYTLPGFSGTDALEIARSLKPEVPFIFVSGTITEDTAISSLQKGATDYVLKDRPARLVTAVRRALTEAQEKSAQVTMEKRLHQARRLQAVSTLAGDVARDVNRLLQKMQNHLHALQPECQHKGKANDLVAKLSDTCEEGQRLMGHLLAFARRTEPRMTKLDPSAFLPEVLGSLRVLLPPSITIELQPDQTLPMIFADPEQIQRILANLTLNSLDAMPAGGTITISADAVEFDLRANDPLKVEDWPYFRLTLADNGTGMDDNTRLRVFEPFFTTKSLRNGIGMGLPEVFGLMRTHNGLIDVQSALGEGTAVSLFFPLPRQLTRPQVTKEIRSLQAPEALIPF